MDRKSWSPVTMLLLTVGCATGFGNVDNLKQETVVTGEREKVASHGRWRVDGDDCVAREVPRLELIQSARHGVVEFAIGERRPKGCPERIPHAFVYYASEDGYAGPDSFRYLRIEPHTGKTERILVDLEVRAAR